MSERKNIMWSPVDYERSDVIAKTAADALLERLQWMTLQPAVVIDMGAGLGTLSAKLQTHYPAATIIAVDQATEMTAHMSAHYPALKVLCADAAAVPLPAQSADLIIANLLLPWHSDVHALLAEWRRLLRPDGLLIVSTLGVDTLREWRDEWHEQIIPHVVDMHDVGDVLLQTGFADPVLDVDYYTLVYKDPKKLVTELTETGMLTSDATVKTESASWEVTYELIYAHAFAPPATDAVSASEDGLVRIPLSHLRERLRSGK